jgi:putative hydrolase of the HAD superfamily
MSSESARVLLLDALGTLVRLEPPAPRLRAELQERFGLEVSEAQATAALAAEIAFYRQNLDQGRDHESLSGLRRRCAEILQSALPQSAALDLPALEHALLASLHFTAFDDAAPTLEALRARGVRLIVVSNWDVSLYEVLARVGLGHLLDGVLTSAEVGVRKPDPAIFHHALELAGVAAATARHVGDSLLEDVQGARAAGIEPVLIARDGESAPPSIRTIATLRELLDAA